MLGIELSRLKLIRLIDDAQLINDVLNIIFLLAYFVKQTPFQCMQTAWFIRDTVKMSICLNLSRAYGLISCASQAVPYKTFGVNISEVQLPRRWRRVEKEK